MIEKAMMLAKKYRKIFQIPEDFVLEIKLIEEGGSELLFHQEIKTAILHLNKHFFGDIVEYVAQVKLGIDYDPLLATMYFQEDITKEEESLASDFYMLILPIIDAWTWKIMSMYLPEEEMERELREIKDMWEQLELAKMMPKAKNSREIDKRRHDISTYLIFKVLGHDATLKLVGNSKYIKEWEEYIQKLEKIAMQTPSVEPLIELAKDYMKVNISVREGKYRYVEIHSSSE